MWLGDNLEILNSSHVRNFCMLPTFKKKKKKEILRDGFRKIINNLLKKVFIKKKILIF